MRIAFVTQWFPPEPGTVVAAAIADGLAARGHRVDVLTGFPNYPTGRLHEGYPLQRYRRDERSDRVTVHRAPLYPSHDTSSLKRMTNYLSFAAGATWVGQRHVPPPDAWLVYSSPATAAIPALLAARRSATPVHLLIEDLWPDSVTQSGLVTGVFNPLVGTVLHTLCNWTYRGASSIGVISPSMMALLLDRGVGRSKIVYTPNWVDAGQAADVERGSAPRDSLGLPPGRLFMYAGNMGELQGLEPLLRAFSRVPSARLVLIGTGVARIRLENVVRNEELTNVSFLDPQPTAVIGRYIAASDIQVISLKDTPLLRATMPSKVQTSLAAGKPVLVHATGDVATLVNQNGLGLACRPGDWEGTTAAIEALASCPAADLIDMGRKSRAYYEAEFSPGAGLDRLESLLIDGRRGTRTESPRPLPAGGHTRRVNQTRSTRDVF
jgi:colanic acid biosynthesis glycosyl transferase WcaI